MIDINGLSHLWERIKGYVASYLDEYDKLAVATPYEKGQVRPDNVTIVVDQDGTIHSTNAVTTADDIGAIDVSMIGVPNGVAELDDAGMIPSSQLPSYVDDVLEFPDSSEFPLEGESGKIYIDMSSSTTYRWGGSIYVEISSSVALGETISTAYRGDRGKIAFEHAASKGNEFPEGLYRFETNAEGHVTSVIAVQKSDITSLGIPGEVPTKVSDLTNDEGYITEESIDNATIKRNADGELYAVVESASFDESDPTVPSWAKQPTKPTYTAAEVGALPDDTVIPTKVSDLSNDEGYITNESDPTVPAWAKASTKPSYTAAEVGALPDDTVIPTKVSDLENDEGYITSIAIDDSTIKRNADGELYAVVESASFDESDPTVPAWAKASTKPTYTASEVGALPDTTRIPTKLSELVNDEGYITEVSIDNTTIKRNADGELYAVVESAALDESDPTVPSWAKRPEKPTYTAEEVGALPDTTIVPAKLSDLYNDMGVVTSEDLHGHLISDFTNDADYATVDMIPDDVSQLSNSIGYMTYEDLPNNVSAFTNDAGYLTDESDPTVPAWAKTSTKPTYTADEVGAISTSKIGTANGVAELDSNGKVPSSQLPSYVDDVLSYWATAYFPDTGETGKIYVSESDNTTYRWSGSRYVMISQSISLGETASTAYRGDRGKVAYEHALAKGVQNSQGMYKFATNDQGHVISADAVQKSDITALGIPGSVPTKVSDLENDMNFSTMRDIPLPDGVTIGDVDGSLSVVKSTTLTNVNDTDYTYILYKTTSSRTIEHTGQIFNPQSREPIAFDDDLYGTLLSNLEFFVFKNGNVYYSIGSTVTGSGSNATFSYPIGLKYIGHVENPDGLSGAKLSWKDAPNSYTSLLTTYRVKVTHEVGLPSSVIQDIPIATNEHAGIVKPDVDTLIVSDDGTLSISKRTSTIVARGDSSYVNKGDFDYVVANVLASHSYGYIYNVYKLQIELFVNNNYIIRSFQVSMNRANKDSISVVINPDGNVYIAQSAAVSGQWFYLTSELVNVGVIDALANASEDTPIRVSSVNLSHGNNSVIGLESISFFVEGHVAGLPIDNDTITVDKRGYLNANVKALSPLYVYNGQIRLSTGTGFNLSSNGVLSVSMSQIFEQLSEESSGLITYTSDTATYDYGEVGIRTATSTSPGIVRPDNKTTFMVGDKLTTKSYDDVIESLQRTVNTLMRRVNVLEDELGLDTMTYDNGTLYVSSTYEDGILVTNRTYEDGTLL